jgi:predicted nucleic acid-binding protein
LASLVFLDSTPLGLVSHPKGHPEATPWIRSLLRAGSIAAIPEIADYEVRRELVRSGKTASLRRLSELRDDYLFVPIDSNAMLRAAELWAEARRRGRPGASEDALDGDVILAAQALAFQDAGHEVVVATHNLKHFELFLPARLWQEMAAESRPNGKI